MKAFVSSVISGFESYRDAATEAVRNLGYEVVRAEDLGAATTSPQQACLAGVREADVTILLLGARYGVKQPSGLSATHEEYREARGLRPVLAFVQDNVQRDVEQTGFIEEVREWETGNLTVSFSTEDGLRGAVTRELHRLVVSAAQPFDEQELLALAERRSDAPSASRYAPQLVLSLALGPRQEMVRPGDLEDESFARDIQREAIFGTNTLFAVEAGTQTVLRGDWLVLAQESVSIEISSTGDIVVRQAAVTAGRDSLELAALIEEDVRESLGVALKFATTILDRIDSVHRLSHVAIIAALTGVSYQPWRTRAEHARSPNAGTLGWTQDHTMVHLNPHVRTRAEISQRADELAHDLMVLLRRELKQ